MSTDLEATQGRDMATEGVAGQENPFPASKGWNKMSDPGYREWSRACRQITLHYYIPQYLPNKEAFASGIMGIDDIDKQRLKYEAEMKKFKERQLAAIKKLEKLEQLVKDDPPCKKPRTSDEDEDEDEDIEEEDEDEDIEEEIDLPLHSEK
ncbi:uncharacterized protein LOC144549705 isoform X2 [Carex rostrata]